MANTNESTTGLAPEIVRLLNNHLVDDLKQAVSAIRNMQLLLAKFDEDADIDTASLIASSASLADFCLLTISCIETNIRDLVMKGKANEVHH